MLNSVMNCSKIHQHHQVYLCKINHTENSLSIFSIFKQNKRYFNNYTVRTVITL